MALSSSLSFLLPLPNPEGVYTSMTAATSSSSSRPCSLSTSLRTSSDRKAQFVAMVSKDKRYKMDFVLDDDDDDLKEDKIPDHIVDMEEWMQNRPSGFGVGKAYDLALEEKLLSEIETDKKAREAAKLRAKAGKGKITPKAKVTEAPAGVEVWVGNLPRKRKVERDLRAAFRNSPGLLHIRPIVEPENEKTREPMCRGFAFFTFATEDDAYDFVAQYSGVKVKFGKVEKKVACEVAKSDSPWHPNPNGVRRASSTISVPMLQVRDTQNSLKSPVASTKTLDRKLGMVTSTSSITSKPLVVEEHAETELRAMEEEIWEKFEDEDDLALDLELSEEVSSVDDDDDDEDDDEDEDEEDDEGELSVRGRNTDDDEEVAARVSVRESLDVGEDRSAEKIKALEAKVREMEKKLQLSAQTDEERIELLEKRLLGKAKAASVGYTPKMEGEKKKAGEKKRSGEKKKSQKPKTGSLGSASRLKAKERAILSGVMSKYVSSSP